MHSSLTLCAVQTGWKSWGVQATENPITSWLLLGSAALFVFQAATAGSQQWAGYAKLFDESRFCHVTTIDFLALTISAPVWMWNDAEVRNWQNRSVKQQFCSKLFVLDLLHSMLSALSLGLKSCRITSSAMADVTAYDWPS